MVFSGLKYRQAKNLVLLEMERDGLLDAVTRKHMSKIVNNAANVQFGRQLISKRVAGDKYSAAAVVFARLAALERNNQKSGISYEAWVGAAQRAMRHAGASDFESFQIAEDLVQQQERDNQL